MCLGLKCRKRRWPERKPKNYQICVQVVFERIKKNWQSAKLMKLIRFGTLVIISQNHDASELKQVNRLGFIIMVSRFKIGTRIAIVRAGIHGLSTNQSDICKILWLWFGLRFGNTLHADLIWSWISHNCSVVFSSVPGLFEIFRTDFDQ